MSSCSAVAVKKGQEQFVDDKSKFEALQGVKVECIVVSPWPQTSDRCSDLLLILSIPAGLACVRAERGGCGRSLE